MGFASWVPNATGGEKLAKGQLMKSQLSLNQDSNLGPLAFHAIISVKSILGFQIQKQRELH